MRSVAQLLPLLGKDYEAKCEELKIMRRKRNIKSPADLMLLCLYHLVNGCSLVNVSEVARLTGTAVISDVGFMKRFAQCGEWFEWITAQMVTTQLAAYKKPDYLNGYEVISVDASDVVEKGRSGESYRLHYGIEIFKLRSHSYKITKQSTGESLTNFTFRPGELVLGDRAYGTVTGIKHSIACGADYLLRLRSNSFNIYDRSGNRIEILAAVEGLNYEESTEISGYIHCGGNESIPIRVCVKRKGKEASVKSRKRLERNETRKQCALSEKAKRFDEYIILATSLPDSISREDILETYRYRWQIENYFKRLKSIMDFGDLPKKSEASSLAWLKGKLMVALLMEILIASSFTSPYSSFEA